MQSASSSVRGRAIAVAIVLALGVAALLLWGMRSSSTRSNARASAPAPPITSTPAPQIASTPADPAANPSARPQPVPVDPSAAPPSLDAPVSKPLAPQPAPTREDTIAKREAGLALLDKTQARLEQDLSAARAAGNATAAHDLEVRLARLKGVREQRRTELDKLRAGGAPP